MGCDSIYDHRRSSALGVPTREERRIERLEQQVRALQAEINQQRKDKRA